MNFLRYQIKIFHRSSQNIMQGKPAQLIDISYPHFVVRRSKFITKLSWLKFTSGFR